MKISVVTVCLNAERTIGRTLESFLNQDHDDKELLIIDGGSRDSTVKIIESLNDSTMTLISEPDDGLYDAMNKGLRGFRGDAVGFLNADDCYADRHALTVIAEGLSDAHIVYGDLDFVDSHDHGRIVRRWRGAPWKKGAFRRGWMPPHPTFYVRRKVVEAVGEFERSLKIAADYDFMLRALELGGFSHQFLPRVLVNMQTGGKSAASIAARVSSNLEALRARRRHLGAGPIDFALVAKPLGKLRQFIDISPAAGRRP